MGAAARCWPARLGSNQQSLESESNALSIVLRADYTICKNALVINGLLTYYHIICILISNQHQNLFYFTTKQTYLQVFFQ